MKKSIVTLVVIVLVAGSTMANSSGVRCVNRISFQNGRAYDVAIQHNYAFVTTGELGLNFIDITDPPNAQEVDYRDLPGLVFEINLYDSMAYLGDHFGDLHIIDLSDPAHPWRYPPFRVINSISDVVLQDSLVYTTGNPGLGIVKVTNPNHPIMMGTWETMNAPAGIAVSGNYAFIGCYYGIRVVDVSDPMQPIEVDSFATNYYVNHLVIRENYAFVAEGGEFLILDISDPLNIEIIGCCDVPRDAIDVAITDTFAYVVTNVPGRAGSLRIINISDLTNPHEVGYYRTEGTPWGVEVSGNYVYVAEATFLGIYDCSEAMSVPNDKRIPKPSSVVLSSAYPNPFNNRATVVFTVPQPGEARLVLLNPLGQRVRELTPSGRFQAGTHRITFGADGLPSGDYLLRLDAGEQVSQKRVILIK